MKTANEWPERAHRQANRIDDHRPKSPAAKGSRGLGHKRGGNPCVIDRRGPSRAPAPPRGPQPTTPQPAIEQKGGGLKERRDDGRVVVFHHASSSRRLDFARCGRYRSGLAGLPPYKEPTARLSVYLARSRRSGCVPAEPYPPLQRTEFATAIGLAKDYFTRPVTFLLLIAQCFLVLIAPRHPFLRCSFFRRRDSRSRLRAD